MNKVKKTITALRMYLGSDKQGQELLIEVSKAANDIRHALAAKSSECERLMVAAAEQSQPDDLRGEYEALREKERQISDQLKQARSRIAILEQQLADALIVPEKPKTEPILSGNRVADIIRAARRHKALPKTIGTCKVTQSYYKDTARKGKDPLVFFVQDFISKEVTDDDLLYLGMCVFLTSGFAGTTVFHSHDWLRELTKQAAIPQSTLREFLFWYRNNMDFSEEYSAPVEYYKGIEYHNTWRI